jgi:effector-binding domain-containing protein
VSEIRVVDVEPTVLASTRQPVAWGGLSRVIMPELDRIYAFLKATGLAPAGHNVCVYHQTTAEGCELEVGVQIAGPFEPRGGILCSTTPSGRAATTTHLGDYTRLPMIHEALTAFCLAKGHAHSGPAWDVYGDWSDDPAERRVDVYRLLGE